MVGPVIRALARGLTSYNTIQHESVTTSAESADVSELAAQLAFIAGLDLGGVEEEFSVAEAPSVVGLAAIREVLAEDNANTDDIDDGFALPPPAVAVDEYLLFAGGAPRTLADINGTPASMVDSVWSTTDGGGDCITVTTDDADIISLCSSYATAGTLLGSVHQLVAVARAGVSRPRRSGATSSLGRCSRPRQVAVAGAVPLQCALRVGRRRVAARPRQVAPATRRCVYGAAR